MRIWNTTPLTGVPSVMGLYGKSIHPGQSVVVDDQWVRQDSRPLEKAKSARKIWVGDSLPSGYAQEVQQKMVIVLNRTNTPKKLSFVAPEGVGVVTLPPNGQAEIDEKAMPRTARKWFLDQDVLLVAPLSLEDLPEPKEDVVDAEPPLLEEEPVEKDSYSFDGRPMKKKRGK